MNITVNHVQIHYEKSGEGPPILLLHGNGESGQIFDQIVPKLSREHTVFALDSRGHGCSQRVNSLSYFDMMEDTAQFILALGLKKPLLYGFSDGGIIGLLLAIHYPDMLSGLMISGANLDPSGLKPTFRMTGKFMYLLTRSPNWKLMLTQPRIPVKDLQKIKIPTLVLAGQRDLIQKKHTLSIAANIAGSKCMILPGESHGSYVVHSEKLYASIVPFIKNIKKQERVRMNFSLRRWKPQDADSIYRLANNPKIAANLRDIFPHPYALEDAEQYIISCMQSSEEKQLCYAIEVDGAAVGSIGLLVKDDVYRKSAELGYWLGEPYWGRGIMTGAIRQICEEAFSRYDLVRIFAEPYAYNTGSRRALEKAGFRLEGILKKSVYKNGEFYDSCIYAQVR